MINNRPSLRKNFSNTGVTNWMMVGILVSLLIFTVGSDLMEYLVMTIVVLLCIITFILCSLLKTANSIKNQQELDMSSSDIEDDYRISDSEEDFDEYNESSMDEDYLENDTSDLPRSQRNKKTYI